MNLTWNPWTMLSSAAGASKPGAPVTAEPWGNDVVVFSILQTGDVQQSSGNPFAEPSVWISWTLPSGSGAAPLSFLPGSPITAIGWGNRIALFTTDQQGNVYQNIGYPQSYDWTGWTPVAGGRSVPGAQVTAQIWGNYVYLFMVDPSGAVVESSGDPNDASSWRAWTSVGGVTVKAGAPITAVPWGNRVALFVTDQQGNIHQNIGYIDTNDWAGWSLIAQVSSIPGATVTAQIWGNYVVLYVADLDGGVQQSSGDPNDGTSWGTWTLISGVNVPAGSPVTAVVSYPNSNQLALFVTDQKGIAYMNTGYPQIDSWVGWIPVGQNSFAPGGAVTVIPWINSAPAVFSVQIDGGIYTTSQASALPDLIPTGITVTLHPDRQAFDWALNILNDGVGDANGAFSVTLGLVYYTYDQDPPLQGTHEITVAVPAATDIQPTKTYTTEAWPDVPILYPPGKSTTAQYQFYANVDLNNQIQETNKSNNSLQLSQTF